MLSDCRGRRNGLKKKKRGIGTLMLVFFFINRYLMKDHCIFFSSLKLFSTIDLEVA